VARATHYYSLRCNNPWVDFNCGALSEHLVEKRIVRTRKKARSAEPSPPSRAFLKWRIRARCFSTRSAELDPRVQVKLLRVLDGVPYYRVGGQKKVAVDTRIVAATNRDWRRPSPPGAFAATSIIASINSAFECRRFASARRISSLSPNTSCGSKPTARRFPKKPSARWSATPGPEMCGNCENTVMRAAVNARSYEIGVEDLPPLQPAAAAAPFGAPPPAWKRSKRPLFLPHWAGPAAGLRRRPICSGFPEGH